MRYELKDWATPVHPVALGLTLACKSVVRRGAARKGDMPFGPLFAFHHCHRAAITWFSAIGKERPASVYPKP